MQPEIISDSQNRFVKFCRGIAERFHLPTTLVKFLIVGGIAFWIYQAALYLFYDSPLFTFFPDKDSDLDALLFTVPDARLLLASVLGIEMAILFQFNAHERWTFRRRRRDGWVVGRFFKFHLSSIVSPTIIVIVTNALTAATGWPPYFSAAVGVLLGFGWNWTMNSLVIWPHHTQELPTETPV
jgi:putative flippase GtrA